ncbi:MAG: tetratricopeptide repeat protein [Pyrinomonadaceae bacterium]
MKTSSLVRRFRLFCVAMLIAAAITFPIHGQTEDIKELRARAAALVAQTNYIDARAPLEKVAAATPNDAQVQLWLGFALLATAHVALTPEEGRAYRARARKAFVAAKAAGDNSQLVQGLIEGIPADGGADPQYATNPKANAAMESAERAFSMGKMDEALSYYAETLRYDPTNYLATLYSGDAYMSLGDLNKAEDCYQKAIVLNPYRETGYRYSATPLMKQKKYAEARSRYVEAWITEPYNRLALSGLIQWAKAVGADLGHPRIDIPKVTVGADGKMHSEISLNLMLGGKDNNSQLAWISYPAELEKWRKEKFAKEYPGETVYRRSLKGELDALRGVIQSAKGLAKDKKKMDPQIAILERLDSEGLLEAYILLTASDAGIAKDHPKYLREHRDKLRDYVNKYVIREKN